MTHLEHLARLYESSPLNAETLKDYVLGIVDAGEMSRIDDVVSRLAAQPPSNAKDNCIQGFYKHIVEANRQDPGTYGKVIVDVGERIWKIAMDDIGKMYDVPITLDTLKRGHDPLPEEYR